MAFYSAIFAASALHKQIADDEDREHVMKMFQFSSFFFTHSRNISFAFLPLFVLRISCMKLRKKRMNGKNLREQNSNVQPKWLNSILMDCNLDGIHWALCLHDYSIHLKCYRKNPHIFLLTHSVSSTYVCVQMCSSSLKNPSLSLA